VIDLVVTLGGGAVVVLIMVIIGMCLWGAIEDLFDTRRR
jgi:hypothetical protein